MALITKELEMRWNSKNKNRYVELGYIYTKMKDSFTIKVEHLPEYSILKVKCTCDYCGEEIEKTYNESLKQRKITNKDCCNNSKCKVEKQSESVLKIYGETNISKTKHFRDKYKEVMNNNYGVDNYFEIYDTKLENNPSYKPTFITCSHCGKISHRKESKINSYENHFCDRECLKNFYKNTYEITEYKYPRSTNKYKEWRKSVLIRDNYECVICGCQHNLEVHHLDSMNYDIYKTFDINNGITLCAEHHNFKHKGSLHDLLGTRNIQKEHFLEYLKLLEININEKERLLWLQQKTS